MASLIYFNQFFQNLGDGVYDFNTDTLAIYLSNTAPNVATNEVFTDLPQIATGNGYTGPIAIDNAYSQSGGVGSLTGNAAATITASGGSVGPFRYIALYDQTPASKPLLCYWDYGSEYTIPNTGTFTVNFDATVMTVQQV